MTGWSDYQEEVAEFFRTLGLAAETNVTIRGVRTTHDVDIVVRSKHAGFEVLWLVECKAWQTRVPKEKVLALRSIVEDTGADRGFLMAEGGYQSGALEAARFANVMLTSVADLKETLSYDIGLAQLNTLLARNEACRVRYWAINKRDRIDLGLRPEPLSSGDWGVGIIDAVDSILRQALIHGFPVTYNPMVIGLINNDATHMSTSSTSPIDTPAALFTILDADLTELEKRLDTAEAALAKRDITSVENP